MRKIKDEKDNFAINDEVPSEESFDSAQKREIEVLDQQWSNLVQEYIKDPNLLLIPPNENDRLIM